MDLEQAYAYSSKHSDSSEMNIPDETSLWIKCPVKDTNASHILIRDDCDSRKPSSISSSMAFEDENPESKEDQFNSRQQNAQNNFPGDTVGSLGIPQEMSLHTKIKKEHISRPNSNLRCLNKIKEKYF